MSKKKGLSLQERTLAGIEPTPEELAARLEELRRGPTEEERQAELERYMSKPQVAAALRTAIPDPKPAEPKVSESVRKMLEASANARRRALVSTYGEKAVAAVEMEEQEFEAERERRLKEIRKAFLKSLPPEIQNSPAALMAFTKAQKQAAEATKDVSLLGRVGVGARTSINSMWLAAHNAIFGADGRELRAILGESTVQDTEAARRAGQIAGVTPPQGTAGQIAGAVGEFIPAAVVGTAAGIVAGPTGAGLVAGSVATGAAFYPYVSQMADVQYQQDLFSRNLDRVLSGSGNFETYNPEVAKAFRTNSALMESSIEAASTLLQIKAAKIAGRAIFGRAPVSRAAAQKPAWSKGPGERLQVGNLRYSIALAQVTAEAINEATMRSAVGRTARAIGGLGLSSATEGVEEVAADVLGARIGRATGAIPEAESTPESREHSFVIGSGAGLVIGLGGAPVAAGFADVSQKIERKKAAILSGEVVAAARDSLQDRNIAVRTLSRMAAMTPEERQTEIDGWSEQRETELFRLQNAQAEAAVAAEKLAKAKGTEAERDAQLDFDAARMRMDNIVANIETIDTILAGAATAVGEETVVPDPDAKAVTPDEVIERTSRERPLLDIRPTKSKGNKVERSVASTLRGLGIDVVFYEAEPDANPAFYHPDTPGVIYMRVRSKGERVLNPFARSRRTLLAKALHEVVHDLQWYSPELYNEIREILGDKTVIKNGIEYLQRGSDIQIIGPRRGDFAAVGGLLVTRPEQEETGLATVLARGVRTESAKLAKGPEARAVARIEEEGVPVAIERGVERAESMVGRALAKVGLESREAKAMRRLLERLEQRKAQAVPRPAPGTRQFRAELAPMKGDSPEVAAAKRRMAEIEGIAEMRREAAEAGETPRAQMARIKAGSRFEEETNLVRLTAMQAGREPISAFSMLELAMTGGVDPRSGAKVNPIMGKRGTVKQLLAGLQKAGVKPEEISWRLGSFLVTKADEDIVTAQEVSDALAKTRLVVTYGPTKETNMNTGGTLNVKTELSEAVTVEELLEMPSDPVPDDSPRIVRYLLATPTNGLLSNIVMRITADPLMPTEQAAKLFEAHDEFKSQMESVFSGGMAYGDPYRVAGYLEKIPIFINEKLMESIYRDPPEAGYVYKFKVDVSVAFDGFAYRPEIVETSDIKKQTQDFIENDGNGSYPRFDGQQLPQMLVEVAKPKKSEGIYRNVSYSPNRLPDSSDYRGSLGRSVVDFTYEIEATYNGPSKWGRPSVTYQANVSSHAGWGETTNAEIAAKGVVHSLVVLNREKALAETYDGFASTNSGGIRLRSVMLPSYKTFVNEAHTDTSGPRMDLRSAELAGSVVVKEQILEPRTYLKTDDLPRIGINRTYETKIKSGTLVVRPDQWSGGDALGDAVTAEIDLSRPIAEQYKALVNKFLESVDLEREGAKEALRGGHVLEGRVVFEYDYTKTTTEVTYGNRQDELNDVIQSSVETGSDVHTSYYLELALKTTVSSEGVPEVVHQGYTYSMTGNFPAEFSNAVTESAQDWMDNDIVGKDFDDIGEAEEIVEGRTFQDTLIEIIESPFLAVDRYPGVVYPANWNAGYGAFGNPLPMSYSDGRFVTGVDETTIDVTTASFASYRPKRSRDNPDYAIFTMTYDSGPTVTDYQEPHGLGDAVSAHVRVTFDSDDVFFIDEVQSTARKEIAKGSIILRPDVFEGIGIQVSDLFPGPPIKTQTTYRGSIQVDLSYDNRIANYWTQEALSEAYEAFDQAVASAFEAATYSDELSQRQGRRTIAAEGVFEHDIVVDPNVTARVKIKFGVYAYTKLDQDGNEILLSRNGIEFVPYPESEIRALMYDPVSARSTLASQVMLGAELNSAYEDAMWSEVAGSLSVQVLSAKHGVIVAESQAYNYGNISMRYNDFRDGIEYAVTTVDDYLEKFADNVVSQSPAGIPTKAMPYVAKPHGGDVRSYRAVASDSFAEAVVKGIIGNSVRIADERNPNRDYDDNPLKLTFPSVKDGMASHMNEKGALAIYGPKGFIPKAAEKVLKSIGSKAQLVTDTPTADAKENTVSIVVDERIADIARHSGFTQFARSKSEALRTPADQFSVVRYNDDTYLVKTQFSRILATHAISPDNFVANIDSGQIVNPSIGVIPAVKAMGDPRNSRVIWAVQQPIVLILSPGAAEKYLPGTTRVADTYSPSGLSFIPAMSSAELTGLMQDVTRRAAQIEERILTSSPEELESIVSGLFDQASIAASAKPREHEVRSIIGKWANSKAIPESAFDPDVTSSRNVVMNAIALVTLQRALTNTLPEPLSMVFPVVDVPDYVAKKLGMPEIRSMIAEIETVLNYDGMSIDQVAAEISSIAAEAANQINVMVSNLSEVGNRVLGWKVAMKGSKTSEYVEATESGLVELAEREWGGNPLGKESSDVFTKPDFIARVVNDKVLETFEDVVNYVTSGKIGYWASKSGDGSLTRVGQALHDIDYHVRSVAMSSWHASTWTPESGRYPYPDKFDHLMESGPNAIPPYSLPRDAAKLKPLDRHMRRVVFAMSQAVTKVLDTGVDARLEDLYSQKWIDIANNPELAGFPSYLEGMRRVVDHVNKAAKAWRELKFSYAESNPVAPIPLGRDGFSQVHLDSERIMDMRARIKNRPGLRTQGGGVRRLRDDGTYKRFLGSVAEFINLGGTVFFHSNSNGEFKTFVNELSDAFMAEAANERPGVMAPGGGVYVSEAKIRSAIKFADMNANRDARAGGFEYSVGYHASQMARAKRFKQNPPIGIAGDSVLNDIALLERTQDPFASNPISYSPFIESSDNDMRRMLKMRHDLIRKTYQETGPYSGGLVKVRDGFELYDPQVDAYYPQADAFGYKNPDTLEREYWNEATRQAHMTHAREVDARLKAVQGLASIHAALSYSIAEARHIEEAMTPEEMRATTDAIEAIESALEKAYPAIDTPSEEVSRVLDANMDRILAAEQLGSPTPTRTQFSRNRDIVPLTEDEVDAAFSGYAEEVLIGAAESYDGQILPAGSLDGTVGFVLEDGRGVVMGMGGQRGDDHRIVGTRAAARSVGLPDLPEFTGGTQTFDRTRTMRAIVQAANAVRVHLSDDYIMVDAPGGISRAAADSIETFVIENARRRRSIVVDYMIGNVKGDADVPVAEFGSFITRDYLRDPGRTQFARSERADIRAARIAGQREVRQRYQAALSGIRQEASERRSMFKRRVKDLRAAIKAGSSEPIRMAREDLMQELLSLNFKGIRDDIQRDLAAKEFREVAVSLVNLLPKRYQGDLARRVAAATTYQRANRLAMVIDARLAQAEYDIAVTKFRKVEKRLEKAKMLGRTKDAIRDALDVGRAAGFDANGAKLRSVPPSVRAAASVALRDASIEAMAIYEDARNDWRHARDESAKRLREIARAVIGNANKRPVLKPKPGSNLTVGTGRRTDPATFASSDIDTISQVMDDGETGPMHDMVYRLRTAESDMYLAQRSMMGHLDGLARQAGFKDLDDLRDRAGDRRGSGVTDFYTVELGFGELRVTLGQLLKLIATDYETAVMMADSEATDAAGNPVRPGVGMKLGDAEDSVTIRGITLDQLEQIRRDHPELAALVEAMKTYRETELKPKAFAAHYRLKGYEPESVPSYEPRRRDIKSFVLDATMEPHQVSATFAENAGFTKSRAGGGAPVIIGDFMQDFMRNADGSLRLAYMAEPTRDMWSVLMNPIVRQAIASRYGEKVLNGLIAMLKHGSGLAPKQSESRFAGITSLSVQGVLAMNPGTWQKVLLGGVVNLSMDMDYADLAAGIAIAPTISMEEIESASGYLWQRNANSANDRRAFTRDDSVGGNRLAGGLTSSARGFIAAYRNLMLAIHGSIEGQPVERAAAVKDAANQFVRAFDPGMLNLMDQEVIRIAVAGHLHRVRIENPDMDPADQMAIAVRRAEMTIRRTQNVSSPIDDSRLVAETTVAGDPLTRALLPFASDPLKSASRLYEGLHRRSPMSTGKWASAAVANAIVGVWANWTVAAVSALLSGDDEEYERLAAEAAKQRTIDGLGGAVLSEIVGRTGVFGFAVGGDAVEMMYRKATDREGFPPDVNLLLLDTAGRTVSDLARFAESAESPTGADLKRGYRGLVGLSQISGLPAPLLRRMENLLPESYRDALKAERIIKGMGRELTPEEADVVSRARSEMRELRELDELRKEMGF